MIRVLIVDDSAVVRRTLSEELSQYSDIEVVGTAIDPYAAREKIVSLRPDVLTLDIEMPRMDGLTFLSHLMKHHPMPVVVVSSIAQRSSQAAVDALALGAVEVVAKPSGSYSVPDVGRDLARALRAAVRSRPGTSETLNANLHSAPIRVAQPPSRPDDRRQKTDVIAIGASTGGTKAIEVVLSQLPPDLPGIVLVQHMPPAFTAPFARRLNERCALNVREASDNELVSPGDALIAPGGLHMVLEKRGGSYRVRVKDGPRVHHQRPAVDVLFHSVAQSAGSRALGVILTGMGADGAKGLLAMRQSGAHTIAEHESSCVVYGMPREAIRMEAVDEVIPLTAIPRKILTALA